MRNLSEIVESFNSLLNPVVQAENVIKENGGSVIGKRIYIEQPNIWAQEAIIFLTTEHNYELK